MRPCSACGEPLVDGGQSGYYCETPRCPNSWWGTSDPPARRMASRAPTPERSSVIDQMIRDLGGEVTVTPAQFIPGRWPFTYAYDYLRAHCGMTDLSRGETACAVKAWCAANHHDHEVVCYALAYRYCKQNGIQVTL